MRDFVVSSDKEGSLAKSPGSPRKLFEYGSAEGSCCCGDWLAGWGLSQSRQGRQENFL